MPLWDKARELITFGTVSRHSRERGATLVEAAIAGIFVFFLIFMIAESAFFARTYLAARDAASSGARAGAVSADKPDADYDILQAINRSISATSKGDVQSIVVFNPQGTSFSMPASCTTGGVSGVCNYYTAADLSRPSSDFKPGGAFTNGNNWQPSDRSTSLGNGLSHLGVYIQLSVGGMVGPLPQTVSKNTIVELEPHS